MARYLGTSPPPAWVLALATPVVLGLGAVAFGMASAGAALAAMKRWAVPDETFVGCWTNDDIDKIEET